MRQIAEAFYRKGKCMGFYAYEDFDRKKDITAKEAAKHYVSIRYYCPNPSCDAHLHLCSVEGSLTIHFKATRKEYRHIPGCPYGKSGAFSPESFDEDNFKFEDMIDGLMKPTPRKSLTGGPAGHGSGITEIKPPHTLIQVYDMCRVHSPRDTYNGQAIGKMLLCDRSAYFWPKGIYGPLIIEGMCSKRFYDSSKKEIYLKTPIKKSVYNLVLKFSDQQAFKLLKDRLFENRDKIIIVGGVWKFYGIYGTFFTEIITTKQYKILNVIFP